MADEVNTTHCRFYENKYPEIDDVVIVNIKEVWFIFFKIFWCQKIIILTDHIDRWYGRLWYGENNKQHLLNDFIIGVNTNMAGH